MKTKRIVILLTVLVVALMLLQSLDSAGSQHQSVSTGTEPSSVNSQLHNTSSSFYGAAISNNTISNASTGKSFYLTNGSKIPTKYVYLPDLHPALQNRSGSYIPSYTSSPAPMGIGDYGVYNNNGNLVSYSYRTTSFEGSISVNNMTPLYVLNDAPQSLGVQLNAILTNVTVGTTTNNVYWTQNVMIYSARTHQIQFVDNIWNFSSPNAGMTNSTLSSHGNNGTLIPNSLYYAVSKAITVSYPFKVELYLNSTLTNGRNEIFFNYSLTSGGKTTSASYDNATFNSSVPLTEPASYYISGNQFAPIGQIPYDAEFVIGGPGGGSTTSLFGMNATMSLKYLSGSTGSYANVKSAFDAGSSTGETANGIAVSWNSEDEAILTAGPSFIYGMWGISTSTMKTYKGSVSPEGSFLFLSNSTSFNNTTSSWVPLNSSGSFNFTIPSGQYTAGIFSNWNNPVYAPISDIAGKKVSLTSNNSRGIYTPIYIFGNSQLSQISKSGSGTAANPYVVSGKQNSSIMPVFGKFNDYAFPVFPGLLVSGTTAYAYFSNLPSFYIYYSYALTNFLNFYGLPPINYLNMEFYNDSNIALLNSSFVSGWFSANLAGFFPAANVILWNTTDSLIASNYFSSMDSSLLIYNYNRTDAGNTVWGNYFTQDTLTSSSIYESINTVGAPTGLLLFSSENLIYNNFFDVYFTAINPGVSIYTGYNVNYTDNWNISREPLSYHTVVMGVDLTGGIMANGPDGIKYQGGNYWWNYLGNGSQMYNNSGLIANGGDMQPLTYHVYEITFTQSGLPSGTAWYVILNNGSIVVRGYGSYISFYEPNGTYFIEIYAQGYLANQSAGYVIVSGQPQSFGLIFRELYYLKIVETGLPSGTVWSINVNGVTGYSNTDTVEYLATNGSYQYTLGNVSGYYPEVVSSTFTIYGANRTVDVKYLPFTFPVTFSETGLASGTEWGVFINGQVVSGRSQSIRLNLPNGTYDYTITGAKGYLSDSNYGILLVSNQSAFVVFSFRPGNFTLTFTQTSLPSGTAWYVTIAGHKYTSTNGSLSIPESTGLYNYTISAPSGYVSSPASGSVNVDSNISVPLSFSRGNSVNLFQILDYSLFAVSVAILGYAFYLTRKRK